MSFLHWLKAVATAKEALNKWVVLVEVGGLDKIMVGMLEVCIVELVWLTSRYVVPIVVGWPHRETLFEVEPVVLLIGVSMCDEAINSALRVDDFLLFFKALGVPLHDLLRAKLLCLALWLFLSVLDRLNRQADGAGVLELGLGVFLPLGSTLISFLGSGGLFLFKLILLDFRLEGEGLRLRFLSWALVLALVVLLEGIHAWDARRQIHLSARRIHEAVLK